jgi:GNAT superfamily N-acetyltransferase
MSDTKGLYLGKSHAEGGIPAVNTDTGQHIEVELNEYKICNSAYSSNKILRYSNKTNKEILDDIHDNFSCRFNKNEVKNGEFIICKVVVLDPTKRSRKGTVRQILDEMQSEKSCNVSQGATMLKNGGEVESLISKSILKLNFYETTPEHAKEFGIEAKKPLYVKNLCVSENERLKGIGKKVLNYLEDYARKNRNDVIFGYVARKASFTKDSRQSFFCDVDMIKNWLHNNGYAINEENNDFHKVVKYADGSNTFDGNNPDIRYEQGGEISEDDKIYKEWTELVNMSASELKAFMKTDEGKDAGLDPKEAKRLGIKSGQESARWIIKMKSTNKDKWTLTMWDWAKRQINFIKRMSGNKGKLFDENGMKTRKHTSLLIWGHDPMKKMAK